MKNPLGRWTMKIATTMLHMIPKAVSPSLRNEINSLAFEGAVLDLSSKFLTYRNGSILFMGVQRRVDSNSAGEMHGKPPCAYADLKDGVRRTSHQRHEAFQLALIEGPRTAIQCR